MSAKLLKAIRKRESAKLRPAPEKPAKKTTKQPEPTESGLGKVTTDDIPNG
jgi:hypothetical protein